MNQGQPVNALLINIAVSLYDKVDLEGEDRAARSVQQAHAIIIEAQKTAPVTVEMLRTLDADSISTAAPPRVVVPQIKRRKF